MIDETRQNGTPQEPPLDGMKAPSAPAFTDLSSTSEITTLSSFGASTSKENRLRG